MILAWVERNVIQPPRAGSSTSIARRLDIGLSTVKAWRNAGLLTGEIANDKGEYYYHLPPPNLPRPRIGRPPQSATPQ